MKNDDKQEPDIAEILESRDTHSSKGAVIDAETQKELSYQLLVNLIGNIGDGDRFNESFILEQITNPQECLEFMLPNAEQVIAHLVDLFPSQFSKTKEVLTRNPNLLRSTNGSRLDKVIAKYLSSLR